LATPLLAKDHFAELTFSVNSIGKADFLRDSTPGSDMGFSQGDIRLLVNIPLASCYGIQALGGIGHSQLDWSENPHFGQKDFNYVDIGIGCYSLAVQNWRLVTTVIASFDTKNTGSDYIFYKGLLWGQYCFDRGWWCDTSLHFGLIGTTGLEESYVLPVIGFAMTPWDCWRVSLVFPMDMSISYEVYHNTHAYIGMRGFRDRHRVSEDEPLPKGVWLYRNLGTEIGIRYDNCCWLQGDIHIGSTWEGDLKVMDFHGTALQHYKSKGALYAGLSVQAGY
jgi:hypothetical protein